MTVRIETLSDRLTGEVVKEHLEAAAHAYCLGKFLNMFVTLNGNRGRVEERLQVFVGRFLKHASEWLSRRGIGRFYISVLENPPTSSPNSHILLHVPPEHQAEFARCSRDWAHMSGAVPQDLERIVVVKPIGNGREGPLYFSNFFHVFSYIHKGAGNDAPEPLRWKRPDEFNQGTVRGRRAITSHALSKSQRKRYEFLTARPQPNIDDPSSFRRPLYAIRRRIWRYADITEPPPEGDCD